MNAHLMAKKLFQLYGPEGYLICVQQDPYDQTLVNAFNRLEDQAFDARMNRETQVRNEKQT